MKKNYITLKHPEHSQPKPSTYPHKSLPKPKPKHSLLSQIPQQLINIILDQLRLAEIVNLYQSIRYTHRYNQMRRAMLNYLILTNRCYTKWEEKQFLDLLVCDIRGTSSTRRDSDFIKENPLVKKNIGQNIKNPINSTNPTTKNPIQNIQISNIKQTSYFIKPSNNNHSSASSIPKSNNKTFQACYLNFSQYGNNNTNPNDLSRLNRNEESIANDVKRTYYNNSNSYTNRNNSKTNNKVRRINSNIQPIIPRRIDRNSNKSNEQSIEQIQIQNNKIQKQNYKQQQDIKQKQKCLITLATQNHSNSVGNLLSPTNTVNSNSNGNNNGIRIQECYQINLHLNQPTPQPNLTNYRKNRNKLSYTNTYDSQNQQSSRITQKISLNQQISSPYYFHTSNPKINKQQHMQNYLKKVLIRISHKYPSIGYIQGFNCIVKNMYMTGFQQQEAFRYFCYFIQRRSLGNIVLNNMEGIQQLSYVLKVYIFNYVPKVYEHLIKVEMEPEAFAVSWFVTLFSEQLSKDIVNKLWHLFVLEGWKIFIKFGIAIICAYQSQIKEKYTDDIFCFMRRILEKFNEEPQEPEIKKDDKNDDSQRKTFSKKEVVWKLMSSVEVNGNIMAQLCKEMKNLQKDSEIWIWRISDTPFQKKLQYSRNERTYSQKILTYSQARQQAERSSLVSWSHLCCDRMSYINQNTTQVQPEQRRNNVFSLCHNVGPYID